MQVVVTMLAQQRPKTKGTIKQTVFENRAFLL